MEAQQPGDNKPLSEEGQAFDVGHRLQMLRKNRGLSQRELARRAGMTNGNLSHIEQGKISPSISTLEKILQAVPMSLAEFFSLELSEISPVITHDQIVHYTKQGVRLEIMPIPKSGDSQQCYMARQWIAPGSVLAAEWVEKNVIISGMVEQGTLNLYLEGKDFPVATGEGFSFVATASHRFSNPFEDECVITVFALPLAR